MAEEAAIPRLVEEGRTNSEQKDSFPFVEAEAPVAVAELVGPVRWVGDAAGEQQIDASRMDLYSVSEVGWLGVLRCP